MNQLLSSQLGPFLPFIFQVRTSSKVLNGNSKQECGCLFPVLRQCKCPFTIGRVGGILITFVQVKLHSIGYLWNKLSQLLYNCNIHTCNSTFYNLNAFRLVGNISCFLNFIIMMFHSTLLSSCRLLSNFLK